MTAIQDEWKRFREGADLGDDTTLIVFKRAPARDPKPGAAG